MELNAVRTVEPTVTYTGTKNNDSSAVSAKVEVEKSKVQVLDKSKDNDNDKKIDKDEIIKINGALNGFMDAINSDLQFVLHDKTKELMLRVVDRRDNKVVKEIPTHEMLDVIANIREYVGSLLDKRA